MAGQQGGTYARSEPATNIARDWIAPFLGAAAVLFVIQEAIAVFTFKLGDWIGGPAVNAQGLSNFRNGSELEWSQGAAEAWVITWMFVAAIVAVAVAWRVVRRSASPLAIGLAACIPSLIFFVIGSDNFQVRPLGSSASDVTNMLAVLALYATPIAMLMASRLDKAHRESAGT